jgi:hypothetical protein
VNQILPECCCSIKSQKEIIAPDLRSIKTVPTCSSPQPAHSFCEQVMMQRKAQFGSLLLIVISATVVLSSFRVVCES